MKFLWLQIVELGRQLTWHHRRRKELDGWAKHFGFAHAGTLGSACAIARRCAGAEAALKRLADAAEREIAEAEAPRLTAAEIERLAMLSEECGEVIQAVGKVLRHGWESTSPYGGRTNRAELEREIGNIRAVVGLMLDSRDVQLAAIQYWQRRKRGALTKWTHHQPCSISREEQAAMIQAIKLERSNAVATEGGWK